VTRVVLHTNVLVAAAYNPASASRRIIEACPDDQLRPASSPPSA
jgi:predicted nucleic acid-binding protein